MHSESIRLGGGVNDATQLRYHVNTDSPKVQPDVGAATEIAAQAEEDWVTFEWSASNWNQLLTKVGCDDNSRMDLFSLSQINKEAANEVIWRMIKKLTDAVPLHNASAFIHSSCKQARHAMQR